ncbi:type I glyceraldehyde-3-phosphate dehydrogenase [Candidatus Kuenenbacteria bacterium HGW-Kuenenbacteria-1]|uniref:Glyceraldehyde-3-phosphate dehydrogenase n=1 Tax=Candidatus Kuenenbacteria bacterium HGW-Kuenenbacteria-1 TaxID=2013812 RepID=A0A2N1UP09_9BACT|nr:MAG: type I glyceraldehyde-3-phosphate dehydrogenase [Candidatus Kuenenbacteria bacterium HGW-Kuenenbacteria-1]
MKKIRIAINGFGRIGRPSLKIILDHPELEIVAINDLTDVKTLAHLLKYDSIYGIYEKNVGFQELDKEKSVGSLIIDNKEILIFAEKDPEKLPWKQLEIDVVLECTGFFTEKEGAEKHLKAGAKKVVISAPSKSLEIPTFVLGVNEEKYNSETDHIISNASCTTNCLAPIVKVLNDNFEIKNGFMTTVHSYTNDQRILDLPHEDLRRSRAAAMSIIPTTTGAAKTVTKIIPELNGKIDGIAMRVPTSNVSIVDFVCNVSKKTNSSEVIEAFKKASKEKMKNILAVCDEPLVSVDYKKNSNSAIVDLPMLMVKDDLIKVVAWYDNEWGYSCRFVEMAKYIGNLLTL